jgi:hypothetical protein
MGKETDVRITLKGRIDDEGAVEAFCRAVDLDLGRAPGVTAGVLAKAALEGDDEVVIECGGIVYGYVERVKDAAIAHRLSVVVACGPADEYAGSVYAVRDGHVSLSLPFDWERGNVFLDLDSMRALSGSGIDDFDKAVAYVGRIDPSAVEPLMFARSAYDWLVAEAAPRLRP